MTSGYVYCSNCGTAATPGQQFCASCGTTLPAAAPAPAPAQPAWAAPPAPPAPVYGAPQMPPYGQVPYGMQMAPPPRNNMLLPVVLIVGLLVIVALVGVGVLIATSSKSTSTSTPSGGHVVATATQGQNATPTKGTTKTPTPEPAGGNSFVITPNTVSCSAAPVTTHIVVTLDGSLPGSMVVKVFIDTTVGTPTTIGETFVKQSDGNWHGSDTMASSTWCTRYGVGEHTMGFQDEGGQVIVETTMTVTA